MKKYALSVIALFGMLFFFTLAPIQANAADPDPTACPEITLRYEGSYFAVDTKVMDGVDRYELWRYVNDSEGEKVSEFVASDQLREGDTSFCMTDFYMDGDTFEDLSYTNGDEYKFEVRAYIDDSNYTASSKTFYYTEVSKVKASNTSSGIKLSWSKNSKVDKFYIYRNDKKIATVNKNSKAKSYSYTDTYAKTKNYKVYYYKVVPCRKGCKGSGADVSFRRVTTPTSVSASNSSKKAIKVKWKKVSGAKYYIIKIKCGLTSKTIKVKATSKKYNSKTIKNLKKGKTYKIKVRAYSYRIYEDEVTTGEVDENDNEIYVTEITHENPAYSAWSGTKKVKIRR